MDDFTEMLGELFKSAGDFMSIDALVAVLVQSQYSLVKDQDRQRFAEWLAIIGRRARLIEHVRHGEKRAADEPMCDLRRDVPSVMVELRCDGKTLARHCPSPGSALQVSGLKAGQYELAFETGWVIWKRVLGEESLRKNRGTGKPLRLAARTAGASPLRSLRFEAMDGTCRIDVRPGPDGGHFTARFEEAKE